MFTWHMKRLFAATALAGLLACSPGVPDRTVPSPAGSTQLRQSSGCANEGSLIDEATADAGAFGADLDDDGLDEQLILAKDPGGPRGCQAILGVIGASLGRLYLPIDDEVSFDLGLPAVSGVTEIDGAAPKEIVVNLLSGASTGFAGLFSIKDGRLVRIVLEGDSPYSRLFPFGGSVGHLEGSDCSGRGTIVISSATAVGRGRYKVVRRFFESIGAAFVLDEQATETEKVEPKDLKSFPEFGGAPFASCPL